MKLLKISLLIFITAFTINCNAQSSISAPEIATILSDSTQVLLKEGRKVYYTRLDSLMNKVPGGGGGVTDHTLLTNIGVKTHAQLDTQVDLNNAKVSDINHNVSTNLSLGTVTATTMDVNSSDGTNATLVEANITEAGLLGADKWNEIIANSLKTSFPGFTDLLTDYSFTDNSTNWNTVFNEWGGVLESNYIERTSANFMVSGSGLDFQAGSTAVFWIPPTFHSGISDGTNTYTLPSSTGTIALTSDIGTSFPGFTNLLTDYSFTDNSTNWDNVFAEWGGESKANYLRSDQSDTMNGNLNIVGKLGVNIPNPLSTLSLGNGSSQMGWDIETHNNNTGDYGFNLESSGGNPRVLSKTNPTGGNRQIIYMGHSNGAKNVFGISDSSDSGVTYTPRFVVNGNGEVGIGLNNPIEKLEVNGYAKSTGFKITGKDDTYLPLAGGGSKLVSDFAELGTNNTFTGLKNIFQNVDINGVLSLESGTIQFPSGLAITDLMNDDTFAAASNTTLAKSSDIKTYVDSFKTQPLTGTAINLTNYSSEYNAVTPLTNLTYTFTAGDIGSNSVVYIPSGLATYPTLSGGVTNPATYPTFDIAKEYLMVISTNSNNVNYFFVER